MMDNYNIVALATSQKMTNQYSSSFGLASRLFEPTIRQHIYNIYGLVRLADEIVDTYKGLNGLEMLNSLEADVYASLKSGYSVNLIVQAFIITADKFFIDKSIIKPFFDSMRTDANEQKTFNAKQYKDYIYGSAEVVGLMCLRVFCNNDAKAYTKLEPGAKALGSAFQKVNFLRDIASDHADLGRYYFPISSFEAFDDQAKQEILSDVFSDLQIARDAISELPKNVRRAVGSAYNIYTALTLKIDDTPASILTKKRIRINNPQKIWLTVISAFGYLGKVKYVKH